MTPTARTLKHLRDQGIDADVTERWIAYAKRSGGPNGVRKDLFEFVDLVYMDLARNSLVGVQACAGASLSARRKKILTTCRGRAINWLMCRGLIEIWGWRKVKLKKGGKAERWKPRIEEITTRSFISPAVENSAAGSGD